MGRIYSAHVNGLSWSAPMDFWELKAAASAIIIVHEVWIGQNSDYGDAAAEGVLVTFKRASGTYASGSLGSTPSKNPLQFGDAASGATLEAGNTTQATADTGALTVFRSQSFNVQAGLLWLPTPETRLILAPTQALVVSGGTPIDALTVDSTIVWEEIG